ncbi:UNVERIFIED_CONTAM: hypothetical protein RMT77_010906 [Armadillidium vulgare]
MSYDPSHSSRFVDYTQPSTSRAYRPSSVSSYEYSPPQKPPRRERSHGHRSRDSSDDRYEGRQVYTNPALEYDPTDPAPSDRAESEFTVRNEAMVGPSWEGEDDHRAVSRTASEIYAATRFPRPPRSDVSHYSYRSGPARSDIVSVKTKTTRDGKLVMETMTAPHPCCPNTKSVCCLMILLNLALLLICLGFIVVLQLSEPAYVWYVGIAMLIVGFLVLFGSMIYCIVVCRETEHLRAPPGEYYWTNHWTKTVNFPELHYSNTQYKPTEYKGSEFSFKTEPSRTTAATSQTRY